MRKFPNPKIIKKLPNDWVSLQISCQLAVPLAQSSTMLPPISHMPSRNGTTKNEDEAAINLTGLRNVPQFWT